MAKRGERATHCKQGHPFEGTNLRIITRTRNGKQEEYQTCRTCRERHAQRLRAQGYHEEYLLKQRYGITVEQRDALRKAQSGKCALCKERTALVVDHDHETGQVRGMLCKGCNVALGVLGDTVDDVYSLLAYLTQDRSQGVV